CNTMTQTATQQTIQCSWRGLFLWRSSFSSEERGVSRSSEGVDQVQVSTRGTLRQMNDTQRRQQRLCTALSAGRQSQQQGEEFASATTFPKLFRLLDTKGALWGSQKYYTAAELKKLINRVRTTNPVLHLPLQVIPTTGGLRQQVNLLLDAESAAAH